MIYLTYQDIQILCECSERTARKIYKTHLFLSEKQDFQRLTVFDFCENEQIELDVISCILPRFQEINEKLKTIRKQTVNNGK